MLVDLIHPARAALLPVALAAGAVLAPAVRAQDEDPDACAGTLRPVELVELDWSVLGEAHPPVEGSCFLHFDLTGDGRPGNLSATCVARRDSATDVEEEKLSAALVAAGGEWRYRLGLEQRGLSTYLDFLFLEGKGRLTPSDALCLGAAH
jgi:hypothetical protein